VCDVLSDGTIRTKLPAADLGRLFLGATLGRSLRENFELGIRVLARTSSERELLTGVVRPLFALLQAT
jgi:TetR/AcrR family transcriptional repressor of nem operon